MNLLDKVELRPIEEIQEYHQNAKAHPPAQIDKIATSIKEYGFDQPIVVDGNGVIIKGHARFEASKKLGLKKVPVIKRDDLDEMKARGSRIMDNKSAESEWDMEMLAVEIEELQGLEFDMELTGFDVEEIEDIMVVPDFQPVSEEEQPRLDEKKKVVCPSCGEEFTPS